MKKVNHILIGSVGLILVLMAGMVMAEKPQDQELKRAVVKIDSLSCGGCFSTINAGLAPLEGYSGMGANLFRKLVAIDFTAPMTAEKIIETLSEAGYPGSLEAVEDIAEKESFAYLESKKTGFGSNSGSCCSGGGYPGSNAGNQTPSGLTTEQGGSCCALPGVAQPAESI